MHTKRDDTDKTAYNRLETDSNKETASELARKPVPQNRKLLQEVPKLPVRNQSAKGDDQNRNAAQNHTRRHPNGRDNRLGPEQLPRTYRQGEHQIALIPQKVLIKPDNHVCQRQKRNCHNRNDIYHHEQPRRQTEIIQTRRQRERNRVEYRKRQQCKICREKDPARGAEFISNQFAQHANTSRNSASTDLPCSARISSTDLWSTSCP